jgi:D-alanyl-D-alanine carboxypeptidase
MASGHSVGTGPPASAETSSRPSASPRSDPTPSLEATPRGFENAARGGKPLPECRYADKPAITDPELDPATLVLDTIYRLPSDFVPDHLVGVGKAGLEGDGQVTARIITDLRDMSDAASAHDAALAVQSAYRSFSYQVATFESWVAQIGEKAARRTSARAGHSEHQLGTAVDFRSADDDTAPWDLHDWATTPSGAWLGANSWRFGFVLSYPRGMADETCYAYEPWHFRWVGRDLAAAVHASGKTLRRYLWETDGPGASS